MYTIFATLIIICSILLVLIILIQNPKGGGLSSSFGGGASQMMGVKKTTDFLEKGTWTLAISLIVLILASNFVIGGTDDTAINPQGESTESTINFEEKTPSGEDTTL
jgi:preprotein translocase subunit SecG|tara:strand:- start:393 stop:713 length:321 start_codon:yes stop_codon:yes gene_type:complete